ncbi:MAG: aldose 1-epimerase [Flavobacteriaceae bacterium]|nr:aldose 1-epimerase [Flavobacteriaceae bacterium]
MFQITEKNDSNTLLNQCVISHSEMDFEAIVYPNLGATLQQLKYGKVSLIAGISKDTEGLASYSTGYNSSFLFPFPNRIAKGNYTFGNTSYQLECNENGRENAIHGCIDHASFTVQSKECTQEHATITFRYKHREKVQGFPFEFDCFIRYRFSKSELLIAVSVTNTDAVSFPYGFGWHPYFLLDNFDDTILSFDGDSQIDCDDTMIPVGRSKHGLASSFPLENHQFDTGFVQKTSVSSLETKNYKMTLSSAANFEAYLQVYTPSDHRSIAIEPMTCIADSFNNKTGLRVLEPKKTVTWDLKMDLLIK